jgi:hypothetical protein
MRRWLFVGLVVAVGCGGSNARPDGGGGSSGGGGSGGHGGGAGDAGDDSGACSNVGCTQTVQDLVLGCVAGGSCVYQSNVPATPLMKTSCYDNGVKVLTTIESSTGATNMVTTTFKVKKGDSVCYTKTAVDSFPANADTGTDSTSDVTIQDPSGALVATTHVDPNGHITLTCAGGSPIAVPDSCAVATLVLLGGPPIEAGTPTCDLGTCTF